MLRTVFRSGLFLAFAVSLIPACNDGHDDVLVVTTPQTRVFLRVIGRYNTGRFDQGGSEIAAYDPASKRLFSVNAGTGTGGTVEVINLTNPSTIPVPPGAVLLNTINCATLTGGSAASPNSAACKNGLLAIAIQDGVKSNPGVVVFYLANPLDNFATPLATVTVGALPDMLTFTPDGLKVIVANEGEPEVNYTVDPPGTISVITVNFDALAGTVAPTVEHVGFTAFDSVAQKAALRAAGVRISGMNTTGELDGVAQVSLDLEPEYITVSSDSLTAYVTLQENNAMAIVSLGATPPVVTEIIPLGFKDWNLAANTLDPSDRDGPGATALLKFVNGPVRGLYQPDGIASFQSGGQTFLIMANEGDTRDWGSFVDEARLSTLALDSTTFPTAATLKLPENFGRLNVSNKSGDTDGDLDFDQIHTFGARSFTIRTAAGAIVWDSGDDIERLIADVLPLNFNASHTGASANALDDRSDNKGPEPEGVTVGTLGGRTYAFVGLERIGGVLVYDVTTPSAPVFQTYINTRDFATVPGALPGAPAGHPVKGLDLGPEGLLFLSAAESPTGKPLLIVSNEISGSITIFQVDQVTN